MAPQPLNGSTAIARLEENHCGEMGMFSESEHTPEAIANRRYRVRISQYIGDGWQIFTANAGGYIGFLLLSALISGALSNVPGVGPIVNGIISGLLLAGYYFVGFKIAHGQRPEFSNFFDAFRNNNFLPIVLTNVVMGLIINIFVVTASLFFIAASLPFVQRILEQANAQAPEPDADIEQLLRLLEQLPPIPDGWPPVIALMGLIILLPGLYLGVCYTLAIPLVVEHKFDFWPALETSRRLIARDWFGFFLLNLTIVLINVLGLCLCCVGLLVSAPLSTCVIVAAYRDIIGLNPTDRTPL
ncbi:DUF2189 domain-containing protein [Parathermosynechococcus lividus]|nr:hypothetical protein [Thermostichus lividus]